MLIKFTELPYSSTINIHMHHIVTMILDIYIQFKTTCLQCRAYQQMVNHLKYDNITDHLIIKVCTYMYYYYISYSEIHVLKNSVNDSFFIKNDEAD